MDVLFRNMFLAITVMLGIGLVHGYDSKSNFRKIDILETKLFVLETKLDVVVTELKYVKEDLKEEKDKFNRFENQLKDENIDSPFDDKDSDLTEHHSVEDHQQEVGLQAMSVEQRIYNAMKDEKNVRKQFEKQMKTDFMTANKHTEIKFTAFTETLAAVIDRKLDAIEDKVRTSVTVLNDASSSIANLTIKVQHNDDAITSLMLESDQLNTTILRYGTKIKTVEVDLANKVQQNDKSITSLMLESDQLNTTLFRYGIKLETIEVDLANNVEDLIDNSHRYKVCLHGGNHSTDGLCECTPPHYGNNCEKGCFNDGKYLEDGSCECSRLYVGAKCEKVRCFNGANYSEDGTCECTIPYYGTHCEKVYMGDCYDIKNTGKPTGIYEIHPRGLNESLNVYCDMDTDDGGWTVFQYRYEGSVEFYRNFTDYTNGFGSLTGEFWLGLQYIHVMTSSVPSVLRIDVAAADGTQAFQTYDDFNISEGPDYKLNIGATSGTAGDDGGYRSLSNNNGWPFTTYDRDRDVWGVNCAELIHGAWWYGSECSAVNLNGEYPTPGTTSTIRSGWGGMIYYVFKGMESLKSSQIMFRRT